MVFSVRSQQSTSNGSGWWKYLADEQNTGSIKEIQGPSDDLCLSDQIDTYLDISNPLQVPPVSTPNGTIYYTTSNSTGTFIYKFDSVEHELSYHTILPYRFTSHFILFENTLWIGGEGCTLFAIEDTGSKFVNKSMNLCKGSSVSDSLVDINGGLSLSNDESTLLLSSENFDIFFVDMRSFMSGNSSCCIVNTDIASDSYFSSINMMIDPSDDKIAWFFKGNNLYSIRADKPSQTPIYHEWFTKEISLEDDLITSTMVGDKEGNIFFSTISNRLISVNLWIEKENWVVNSPGGMGPNNMLFRPSTPALSPNLEMVYVVLEFTFLSVNITTGKTINSQQIGSNQMPLKLVVDGDDRVYFQSENELMAVDGKNGKFIYSTTMSNTYTIPSYSSMILVSNYTLAILDTSMFQIISDKLDVCVRGSDASIGYQYVVGILFMIIILLFGGIGFYELFFIIKNYLEERRQKKQCRFVPPERK